MRRLWTDEERRSICLQTTAPDVSVAQVAFRYTLNANLVFKCLRNPKYRPARRTGSEGYHSPVRLIAYQENFTPPLKARGAGPP
jgi:transposase-like protein